MKYSKLVEHKISRVLYKSCKILLIHCKTALYGVLTFTYVRAFVGYHLAYFGLLYLKLYRKENSYIFTFVDFMCSEQVKKLVACLMLVIVNYVI